jgi:predicted ATP-dependent endonuclease of OLD family
MKINSIKLNNFRGYKDEINIELGDLTAFVGKNDIGKSSILDALDIFFNESKGTIKLDKEDINKQAAGEGDNEICIAVCFEELPDNIIIDSTNETTLLAEYLLNSRNQLEIIKKYPNAGKEKVFVKAHHPTNPLCADLLHKKDTELRAIIADRGIVCDDRNRNAVMRTSIWIHYNSDLQLNEVEIDVTKGDTKSIWEKLQNYLPLFTLFQSDRKNSDADNEVQDPLKEAVRQILNNEDLKRRFNEIASEVDNKLREVSARTLEKLREMNPEIANSLNPVIPPVESLKWTDVFKNVSITGDEEIPINKRGSGIKRLILLNFFRAEAERRRAERNIPSIVYAIEEPETSQHTEHQKLLIKSLKILASGENTQILITTHSAAIVKELEFEQLRLISMRDNSKSVQKVLPGQLPYPSLNEVNFLAFAEVTEEYHNELYGFLEAEGQLIAYKNGRPTMQYIRIQRNGSTTEDQIVLTEYIRHQIHHPENIHNVRYTSAQLHESITQMRTYIQSSS